MPLHAETPAERRLREVPWEALDGLAPLLAPPLAAVLDGHPADRLLDRLLRSNRHLTGPQRTVVAESLFGVGLWRRRLRAQLGDETAAPLVLLASLARDLGHRPEAPRWLGVTAPPALTVAHWPDRFSFPDWLATHFTHELHDEAPRLAAALDLPGPVFLRANRARITPAALAGRLLAEGITTTPGHLAPDCLLVTTPRPNLLGTSAWTDGLFEVQDEGSQLIGALVDAQPDDTILDLCAGAGGKSLQLASLLGPRGLVHAVDPDASKLDRLRTRASHARVSSIRIHGPTAPDSLRPHRVLVDAPCSELGTLRRGPDLRWRLGPDVLTASLATQRHLLERAAHLVRAGGRIVYATCTVHRAENRDVVEATLAAHPELTLVPPPLPAPLLDGPYLRLLPHLHDTDGFFAAILEKC